MESVSRQEEVMDFISCVEGDTLNCEQGDNKNKSPNPGQLDKEEQLNSEETHVSENGLALKETLQARILELEALYEKTRLELEATREALSKIETAQKVITPGEQKAEEALNSETEVQKGSQSEQETEEGANKEDAGKNTFKIYVGNLSYFATSSDIRELFEAYGTVVEADVVKNYGFVHMENEKEAQAAIKALNGQMLRGKPMNIEASTGIKKGINQTTKIFVGNVHRDAKRLELKSLFEAYGTVVEADILINYAFVHMDDVAQAEEAIQKLDGHEFHGLRLTVQKSTSRGRLQAGMGGRDMYFRFGPSDRGGHSFGNRYDPYPPPPPSRFARDRMLRFRDDMFDRNSSLPPLPEYMKYGRQIQLSRYPIPSPSVSSYPPPDRSPY